MNWPEQSAIRTAHLNREAFRLANVPGAEANGYPQWRDGSGFGAEADAVEADAFALVRVHRAGNGFFWSKYNQCGHFAWFTRNGMEMFLLGR